jgi:uncharacterized protein (TIGR03545 family)
MSNEKKNKRQGPFRIEAIVPTGIIFALLYAYFLWFFDANLRWGLQYTLTQINGAQVDIGSVRTSFLGAYFHLYELQMTDKTNPEVNALQIGSIKLDLLWDGLLRAKFVVDEASVENIALQTRRRSPGYVIPPPPPAVTGDGHALARMKGEVLGQAQTQFNQNVLGDIAAVLGGTDTDDQLESIKDTLKAEVRIKEIQEALKQKEAEWKKRLAELPNQERIKGFETRWKSLDFKSKDPSVVVAAVKEADKIVREVREQIQIVDDAQKSLKGDVTKTENDLKSIDDVIKQDLRDLQARLKLPELDPKAFAMGLFGRMFGERLAQVRSYYEVAKNYIPPPKSSAERQAEQILPRPRGAGRNIKFRVTTGYPLFWLKKAKISSRATAGGMSGNVDGELVNLTSDPDVVGQPAVFTMKGDFPAQGLAGLEHQTTLDFRNDQTRAESRTRLAAFPVTGKTLADGADLGLAFQKAVGNLDLVATLNGARFKVESTNQFSQVDYVVTARKPEVQKFVQDILTGIPMVDVKSRAEGEWGRFRLDISSNLGSELSRGFQAQLNARIEAAKAKLKAMVDEKIKAERDKLKGQIERAKAEVTGEVDAKKKELETAKGQAEASIKQGKTKQKDETKKKIEDSLKKKLKGIKF